MGIRFQCPKCQRQLNVKSHQAGLKGRCPHCGAEIVIPHAANSPDGRSAGSQTVTDFGLTRQDLDEISWDEDERDSLESEPQPVPFDDSAPNPSIADNMPKTDFVLDKPENATLKSGNDPILEAPKRIWYTRHPDHGEQGPLKAARMQEMIDTNQIPLGALVWREDWEDWEPILEVFPHYGFAQPGNRKPSSLKSGPNATRKKPTASPVQKLAAIVAVIIGLATIVGMTIVLFLLINQ